MYWWSLDPVAARHDDVRDHQVPPGRIGVKPVDRFHPVAGFIDLVPFRFEHAPHVASHGGLVVHHEDACRARLGAGAGEGVGWAHERRSIVYRSPGL